MSDPDRVVFLKGKKTVLRPLCKKTDIEKCWRWVNDPDTGRFLGRNTPMSYESEEQWFDSIATRKTDIVLAIDTLDGVFIGTMGIHGIDWVNRRGTTGALIGEKEYLGKGYGQDAKMTLLAYAFGILNLQKICSLAFAGNLASVGYNLRCGYCVEGVRKRHLFRYGQYHDEALLAVFADEWQQLGALYHATGVFGNDAHVKAEMARLKKFLK